MARTAFMALGLLAIMSIATVFFVGTYEHASMPKAKPVHLASR